MTLVRCGLTGKFLLKTSTFPPLSTSLLPQLHGAQWPLKPQDAESEHLEVCLLSVAFKGISQDPNTTASGTFLPSLVIRFKGWGASSQWLGLVLIFVFPTTSAWRENIFLFHCFQRTQPGSVVSVWWCLEAKVGCARSGFQACLWFDSGPSRLPVPQKEWCKQMALWRPHNFLHKTPFHWEGRVWSVCVCAMYACVCTCFVRVWLYTCLVHVWRSPCLREDICFVFLSYKSG